MAHLISRFKREGPPALETRHGGGPPFRSTAIECERILREFRRPPDRRLDGTATWSLVTRTLALRRAPDGLAQVSTHTIGRVLHEAGYTWQQDRTWCQTGKALRVRKSGTVEVTDPDACAKKNSSSRPTRELSKKDYPSGRKMKPDPTRRSPILGITGRKTGEPARQPHEYARNGTATMLTLFNPATGQVRVKGITTCPHTVLHEWVQEP